MPLGAANRVEIRYDLIDEGRRYLRQPARYSHFFTRARPPRGFTGGGAFGFAAAFVGFRGARRFGTSGAIGRSSSSGGSLGGSGSGSSSAGSSAAAGASSSQVVCSQLTASSSSESSVFACIDSSSLNGLPQRLQAW